MKLLSRTRMLLAMLISACAPLFSSANDTASSVVVDTAPIAALVAAVMQDKGTAGILVDANASAHHAQLKPSQIRLLRNADVVIHVSQTFTPWLTPKLATLPSDVKILELMSLEDTQRLPFREGPLFDVAAHGGEEVDEEGDEHGHKQGSFDDHGWLSPDNAIVWLSHISTLLQQVDPANATHYRQNAEQAVAQLQAWSARTHDRLAGASHTPYIVYHDAFQYFEAFAGLPAAAAIADSHEAKPGARRLLKLQQFVVKNSINCLLVDARQSLQLVDSVFSKGLGNRQQVDLTVANPEKGLDAYIAMVDRLADALVGCVG